MENQHLFEQKLLKNENVSNRIILKTPGNAILIIRLTRIRLQLEFVRHLPSIEDWVHQLVDKNGLELV